MYCSNYPPLSTVGDQNLGLITDFEQMFREMQESTPYDTDDIFDLSVSNSYLSAGISVNISRVYISRPQ